MADEIANSTPASAASPAAPPAEAAAPPVLESTAPAPVETAPAPAPVEPAPAEPASPAEPETKKTETLLAKAATPEEEKPVEAPADPKEGDKPSEVKPEEAAPAPTYEPFVLPEGVVADEAKLGEFTKELSDFEVTTKASHEEVQKLGQQLVERHIGEMQRYTESLTQAWEKQKLDWKDSFLKSSEFANRTDTVVNAAIDAIGIYGGDAKQQTEFRELMESSGLGNHPAMIRVLSNVMLGKVEPKPLAAPTIATGAATSKIQKMYGKKTG